MGSQEAFLKQFFSQALILAGFLALSIVSTGALANEEAKTEPAFLAQSEDPERIQQIKKATDLIRNPESLKATPEVLAEIIKEHEGLRFLGDIEAQGPLSKPAFDWINNNLFDKIEKPFVGYFPLKEEDSILGFVVIKKEMSELPVIYLVSPEGDLKHLTRRL